MAITRGLVLIYFLAAVPFEHPFYGLCLWGDDAASRYHASPRLIDRYNTTNTMQIFTGKLLLFLARSLERCLEFIRRWNVRRSWREKLEEIKSRWIYRLVYDRVVMVLNKMQWLRKISGFILLLKICIALVAAINLRTLNQNKTKNWRYLNNITIYNKISNNKKSNAWIQILQNFFTTESSMNLKIRAFSL